MESFDQQRRGVFVNAHDLVRRVLTLDYRNPGY
jgi:hypothetical protein